MPTDGQACLSSLCATQTAASCAVVWWWMCSGKVKSTTTRSNLPPHSSPYHELSGSKPGWNTTESIVRSKEKNYWSRCIADAVSQPCRSWNLLKCLLRPSDIKPKFNQDEFAQFFHFKVQSIRDSIAGSEFRVVSHPTRRRFPAFRNVTTNQEVSRLIGRCPSSQCSLDPALTWLNGTFALILANILHFVPVSSLLHTNMQWWNQYWRSHRWTLLSLPTIDRYATYHSRPSC